MNMVEALKIVGRPIAYYPVFSIATGSNNAGVLLSQFMYWEGKQKNVDGWIYKKQKDITSETGLTRYEQETARKKLKGLKILEEKRVGVPATMHFRFNWDVLHDLVMEFKTNKDFKTPKTNTVIDDMRNVFDSIQNKLYEDDPYNWTDKDYGQISNIRKALSKQIIAKSGEDSLNDEIILKSWKHLLDKMPEWYKKNHFTPSSIYSNYSAIVQQIISSNKQAQNNKLNNFAAGI